MSPLPSPPQRLPILGGAGDCVDFAATLAQIDSWVQQRRLATEPLPCRQVCTVNPEFIVDAGRIPAFATALAHADLCVPDGGGVLWAAARLGRRLPERVTGSDGSYHICAHAAQRGWRVFFLGAAPGVAQRTAQQLARLYPGLPVAGCYAGSPTEKEWPAISAALHGTSPDILFVAYGHPRQDFWIHNRRTELPAAVAIGVGGAFDFVAGVTPRAPAWLQQLNLEWLRRLLPPPWRWGRMLKLPIFVWKVFRQRRHSPSTDPS